MADQKSIHTGKHRGLGEGAVLFIWNLLIGVLLLVFVVLYVPFYLIRRLIRHIRQKRETLEEKA